MRAILTTFSLCFYLLSIAQDYVKDNYKMTVISTKGTNVHSEPNSRSNIMQWLPFGTELQVKYDEGIPIDTIDFFNFSGMPHSLPIDGRWFKIQNPFKKGYVFSAYLGNRSSIFQPMKNQNINENHILLRNGCDCVDNIWYKPNLNWYGFFKIDNRLFVEPVDIDFFNTQNQILNYCTTAQPQSNLHFIYGTQAELNSISDTGRFGKFHFDYNNIEKGFYDYPEFSCERFEGDEYTKLYLTKKGKKQLLNPNFGDPRCVYWKGDIDSDGEQDYIIIFGERDISHFLFLSSAAEENQIIKLVSILYGGYCC